MPSPTNTSDDSNCNGATIRSSSTDASDATRASSVSKEGGMTYNKAARTTPVTKPHPSKRVARFRASSVDVADATSCCAAMARASVTKLIMM